MFRTVFVVAALVGGLCLPSARAQTPFGGDDAGFIPPAADATCEAGLAKAADKLSACIDKCHASRASGKLADDIAEDSCEFGLSMSCGGKFFGSFFRLKGCPKCISLTSMAHLAGTIESFLAGNNSAVYCDTSSGTPFGGDDTGDIPTPKSASAKCEAGAAKAEGKLIACIDKCHASRASGKLADETAEDSCEKTLVGKSCAAKFTLAISKLKGCPACINGTTMANLAGLTETVLDGNNSLIYCGGAPSCPLTTFDFSVNSSGGGPITDSSWDDGSMTQPSATAPCRVTVQAPSGDITIPVGDAWFVSDWRGFSSCVLTGGCNANGGTCTSCNGVDAPSSCPPLGIPSCTDDRPSCSTGLNGNASASAHVTCSSPSGAFVQ
jgi:hypothetical protein